MHPVDPDLKTSVCIYVCVCVRENGPLFLPLICLQFLKQALMVGTVIPMLQILRFREGRSPSSEVT